MGPGEPNGATMASGRCLYRFTRDLRLDDHAGLAAAAERGTIVPVLILDARQRDRLTRSPRRAAYFCAAVHALDAELRERGSRLVVRRGDAGAALLRLAVQTGAAGVAWSIGYGPAESAAELQVQSTLEEAGIRVLAVHDAPAVSPLAIAAESPAGEGYRAFVPFARTWERQPVAMFERPLLLSFETADVASEALPDPAEFGAVAFDRAEGARDARRRFEAFVRNGIARYGMDAGLPSEDATSQLGAALSFGTLSARMAVVAARQRRDDLPAGQARSSAGWFLRSLARRDFFLHLAWFHPETARTTLQNKMRDFPYAPDHSALPAWERGETGYPLVDAGMRQLLATGWMHPAVRPVAASFLCFDLGVDWRVGRDRWDDLLIEDDQAVAIGNWQWIAAVGADLAAFPRIYNPQRRLRWCDPDGAYVRRWVPELATVPMSQWHRPGARSRQLRFDLIAPTGYPAPVVDHASAARDFLARYRAFESARTGLSGQVLFDERADDRDANVVAVPGLDAEVDAGD